MNKYDRNIAKLISEIKYPLPAHFTRADGTEAQLDDLVWYYHANDKRRTRIMCCVFDSSRIRYDTLLTKNLALPSPYNHLLKTFIIETFNKPCSVSHRASMIAEARYILTKTINVGLHALSNSLLNQLYSNRRSRTAHAFIEFCHKNKLISSTVALYGIDNRDRTGESSTQEIANKLPDEDAIIALGNVYRKVFENVDSDGKVRGNCSVDIGDAFTIAMICLALGSPNRVKAEQLALTKQKIEEYSIDGKTVYSLNWKGSKGFGDNKKHILSSMHKPIEKCLNFFNNHSEKARILCSYYHNPKQSISSLLNGYHVDPERMKMIDIKNGINLFQLGYLLEFYPEDLKIKVVSKEEQGLTKKGLGREHVKRKVPPVKMVNKKICDLSEEDLIRVSGSKSNAYAVLLGSSLNGKNKLLDTGIHSIKKLQDTWIDYFKEEVIPEFPLSYTPSENYVDLRFAMFAITGHDIPNGLKMGSWSYYYIFPMQRLSSYLNSRIRKNNNCSIFSKYGYSSSLGLNSHSLRHYNNTLSSLSNIPTAIITAWSGRKNQEQTHTYIHTDDGYKAERINIVIQGGDSEHDNIRVKSLDFINESTELWATATSTGICTQNITVTPCEYLNDFVSQCFLCPQACYICGDEESISLLSKDYEYQSRRLSAIESDKRILTSKAMQRWFKIHYTNTYILNQLIEVLKNNTKGAIVELSVKNNTIKINGYNGNEFHSIELNLPDADSALSLIKRNITKPSSLPSAAPDNRSLDKIIRKFGINVEDL
ncbi:hypothetical protein [Zobellella taiwanensis]